jgi:DNA-binding NarL/FixJ family response regulator
MRVILVGTAPERARLRAEMARSADVIGEYTSLAAARATRLQADAIVVASGQPDAGTPELADSRVRDPIDALTAREIQVLELLAGGLSNKAIAARLGISDQTVKFHVATIYGKLNAKNRTDAVRLAVRRGLVTL